eukprot:CAMPEP_0113318006 /NCGR_PEP_ID=MMETSP0010_2-20120614/12724_1 /TAXON_ID=216773 ORGANISM="Corethron hystrix, Strain 308" /NCGR_SAMPLE_ID=MMETSP0010_2 /ASSEMBLY_ACC=CAM_ASM_000155 /LENGTH=128 /DNA_ID=CAMNT_0000175175 /DNA_START=192 /DNA_END=578 /DNA_ORIENTATION=+ /assembly_acc=CAM_ASM_000155
MAIIQNNAAFSPPTKASSNEQMMLKMNVDDDDDDISRKKISIQEFLDTPTIDPDEILEASRTDETNSASSPLLTWFAELVKNDYNTAEALYVGIYFSILVVLTQELLRWQIYGSGYVPFVGSRSHGMF